MNANQKTKDERSYRRLTAAYLMKYETGQPGEEPRVANLKNLGAGGVKFFTREILPETSEIKVDVLIPPLGESFHAQATVLRTRRMKRRSIYSVAACFTGIPESEQTKFNAFIEKMSRQSQTVPIEEEDRAALGRTRGQKISS